MNPAEQSSGWHVVVRVRGHLDPRWVHWFGDLQISLLAAGDTLLQGEIADQAALYGLINRLRDLGLELISLNREDG